MAGKAKKYRFKGHESFILREGWLNKGLLAVNRDPKVFHTFYGADSLGVGPNMAKAIRYWMNTAGLIGADREGVTLTETGRLILEQDPYLEDIFTLWILHCNIVCNRSEATAWSLFFNEFAMEEFSREELLTGMRGLSLDLTGTEKTVPESSLSADCDAILQMYARRRQENYDPEEKKISPFTALGLVRFENGRYVKKQPSYDLLKPLAFLYCLIPFMEEDSVSIDTLVDGENGPGHLLNLKRSAITQYVDQLAGKGYLSVNHTAGLDMVYFEKKITVAECISTHFDARKE